MPGPPPIPTALKILRGNPGNQRLNLNEPKFTGRPRCPSWLDPDSKAEWRRIVPNLIKLGVATEADQAALVCYCQVCSHFKAATLKIQRDGVTAATRSVASSSAAWIIKIGQHFGMTPASRSKVRGKVVEKKSALQAFMDGG